MPMVLGYVALLWGDDIAHGLGMERGGAFGGPFLGSVATAILLFVIAARIHRRWLNENGYTKPSVRRSTPPQIWIGIAVLIVGFSLPTLLGAGYTTKAVVTALTLMSVVALVVVAGLQEPKRKAADEAKHRAKWENPFD